MQFAEPLPDQCPPPDAADSGFPPLYRIVTTQNPTEEDFCSSAARGIPAPEGVDGCRWASCSLVLDAKKQKKLPKFKDTHHYAAKLNLPAGAGKARKTGRNHFDFWRANTCNILAAIEQVVEI